MALAATCQLSYVAAVIVIPIFLGVLAAVVLADRSRPTRVPLALLLLAVAASSTVLAVLVYYRGFSPLFAHALTRAASDAPLVASGDAATQSFFKVLLDFTSKYFAWAWAPASLVGLVLLSRRPADRPFVLGWALTYFGLLFGRAYLPFVFQHPHDALFVTPLVCLAAGESVAALHRGTGWRPWAAVALFAALAVQGLFVQWTEWSRHLARAV